MRFLSRCAFHRRLLIILAVIFLWGQFQQLRWLQGNSPSKDAPGVSGPKPSSNKWFPRTITLPAVQWKKVSVPRFPETSSHSPLLDDRSPGDETQEKIEWEEYMVHQFTKAYRRDCKPAASWMHSAAPSLVSCNIVHEIPAWSFSSPSYLLWQYLGRGGWRNTMASLSTDYVFKMYRLDSNRHFTPVAFERHRVDALLSEKLTASTSVLNIYGYCGMTTIVERASCSLQYWIRHVSQEERLSHILNLAFQLASALTALHELGGPGHPPALLHRDIKTDNVLIFPPSNSSIRLALSDFNDSLLRNRNRTTVDFNLCPFYSNAFPILHGLGFTPPEMSAQNYPPLDSSIDIYGLGAVLYHLLVGHPPHSQGKRPDRAKAMNTGQLPRLPEHSLSGIIAKCLQSQPARRPTAREVLRTIQMIRTKQTIVRDVHGESVAP